MASLTLLLSSSPASRFVSLAQQFVPKGSIELSTADKPSPKIKEGSVAPVLVDGENHVQDWAEIAYRILKENKEAEDLLVGDRKKEIDTWLTYQKNELLPVLEANEKQKVLPALHKLNKKLEPTAFIASNNRLSLADLALFPFVHPLIKGWKHEERFTYENICRWYDNIQHLPQVSSFVKDEDLLIEFDKTPPKPVEKKVEPQQQKGKQGGKGGEQQQKGKGGEQQQKGKGGEQQQKGKQAPAKPAEVPVTFSRLDMRVGKITKIEKHPDAESLYKEEIDVGEEKPRSVVSGLVKYVPIEEMRDRLVIVLCNLKPANMRGVKSEAMLICASHTEGEQTTVEPVIPPEGSLPGDKVFVEGEEGKPDGNINLSSKNNIFKTIQESLKTNDSSEAVYKDNVLKTNKGILKVKSLKQAHLG